MKFQDLFNNKLNTQTIEVGRMEYGIINIFSYTHIVYVDEMERL